MDEIQKSVECSEHGVGDATYVCQHLVSGIASGFHCDHDDGDQFQGWPDAWCDACDRVYKSEGGWNERSEALVGVRLLCDRCYQRVRERNWKQDDQAFRTLVDEATAYLQPRQDQLTAQYGLGSYPRYDWDQETGHLIFSDNGQARVIADIQFVGSISTQARTWLWSWANQSIQESVKRRVRAVRTYGDDHRYLKLASACWAADEGDGWDMTAICAFLMSAAGAYRSPDDRGFTFLVMTDVRWARSRSG
jgi:hypothetical protein